MNSFGEIKTRIETFFEKTYGKESFKEGIKGFKKHVLNKKKISEAYFLYDELSSKKGLNENIVDEYISESFEHLKSIIEDNKSKIQELSDWINSLLSEDVDNKYVDIDSHIYTKNIVKNLESLIESKQRIRKNLISVEIVKENHSIHLPLSTMLKVATNAFNSEYSSLNESDKNELKYFISLKGKTLNEEVESTKNSVLDKLNLNLTESTDTVLKEKLQKTIDKINESECSLSSLYRLKELDKGLLK